MFKKAETIKIEGTKLEEGLVNMMLPYLFNELGIKRLTMNECEFDDNAGRSFLN